MRAKPAPQKARERADARRQSGLARQGAGEARLRPRGGHETEAGAQRQVAEQLFAVLEVLDANAQLRRMLSDPSVDADRKARLAADLFGEQLTPQASEILEAVVRAPWGRPSDLIAATDELAAEALFATAEKTQRPRRGRGRAVPFRPHPGSRADNCAAP